MPQPTSPPSSTRPIGLAPGVPLEAAGQDAAKYGSTNPVVTRLLDRWTAKLTQIVGPIKGTVIDVGIGEGLCLDRLMASAAAAGTLDPGARFVGIEYRFDKAAVSCRLDRVDVAVADAGMLPFPTGSADLVTCIEVLEHLPAVEQAVAELARVCRERCIVSVPYEPWFKLGNLGRGKNIRRLGNDPEHLHAFSPGKLRQALTRSFAEVEVTPVFPWLVAEARGPRVD